MGQQDIWYEEYLEFGDESFGMLDFMVDLLGLSSMLGTLLARPWARSQGGWVSISICH